MRHRVLYQLSVLICVFSVLDKPSFGQRISSASLSGRVADTSGHPLSVDVLVYGRSIVDGRVDLFAMCSTTTDVEGRYECKVPPGAYIVSATQKQASAIPQQATSTLTYSRTFSPSENSLNDATQVAVPASGFAVADIVMRANEPGKLHGELTDHPKSASLLVRSHSGQFDLPVKAAPSYDPLTGKFVVDNLAPGTYSIAADWAVEGSPHHEYGIAQVVPKEDRKAVLAELKWHEIAGTLHFGEDDSLKTSLPASVELDGLTDHPGWRLEAKVDPDGSFRFPPIVDGEYVLRTVGGSESFVNSISRSGKPHEGDLLKLTSETGEIRLDVKLGVTHASLTGTLDSDNIVSGKTGVVLEAIGDGWMGVVIADKYGKFYFRNLPPGEYRAYAWTDLSKTEYRDPSVLARNRDKSQNVKIDNQSQPSNVELTLISPKS
jgi:hypothetical protein